jgi:hypothetical protein
VKLLKRICWIGVFAVAGCSALSKPVTDPVTGEPQKRPDGSDKTVFDTLIEFGGGAAAILGGNPLWGTLIGAAGALGREKVVGKDDS